MATDGIAWIAFEGHGVPVCVGRPESHDPPILDVWDRTTRHWEKKKEVQELKTAPEAELCTAKPPRVAISRQEPENHFPRDDVVPESYNIKHLQEERGSRDSGVALQPPLLCLKTPGREFQLAGAGFPTRRISGGPCSLPQPSPTSTGRQGLAPHAVLAVAGGAVDGGLPVQGEAGLAAVGDGRAVVELAQQPARVLPVGDVRRGLAGDACRGAERGFSFNSSAKAPEIPPFVGLVLKME